MSNFFQIFFLILFILLIFNPFVISIFLIFFIFFILSTLFGGFRIYNTRAYSYSKSREFEFYQLSFLIVAKLISILGSMTGEQLNYINFNISSLNFGKKDKEKLYTIFHSAIVRSRNIDKVLFTLKVGYFQHKDLFVWLINILTEVNDLSGKKNLEGMEFINYVSEFFELNFENSETREYRNFNNIKIINPYEVIGVKYNSSEDEIKKAYKRLVIKYHPDRFVNEPDKQKDANEKFIKIQDAYEKICQERNIK